MLAKKRLRKGMERFRRQFGDQPTQALGTVLPAPELRKLVDEEVGPIRERIYPPLTTLGLFIGQALSPDGACQDAVARRLSERMAGGQAACSLNSGPYCKARKRLPLGLVRRLALNVGETLEQDSPMDWKPPQLLKVGFGLRDDLARLQTKLGIGCANVTDLAIALRQEKRGDVGAKTAVARFFGQRLQKSKKTSTTNWANPRLTERQLLYAANDAHVALRVYRAWRRAEAP